MFFDRAYPSNPRVLRSCILEMMTRKICFAFLFKRYPILLMASPYFRTYSFMRIRKISRKDPFFAMTRRSLNTYMNALTGQTLPVIQQLRKSLKIFTTYSKSIWMLFSSLNFNEMKFHAGRTSFGIFSDPQDPECPLEYKGIVYNEMKGAMSSPCKTREVLNHATSFLISPMDIIPVGTLK